MSTAALENPLGKAMDVVLTFVQDNEDVSLATLVESCRTPRLDEATLKAGVLRLSFEGKVDITADWKIRLVHGNEFKAA